MSTPIVAQVKDHYNQTVLTDSSSSAEITVTNYKEFSISGQNKVTAGSGIYTFSNFSVFGFPGSNTSLEIAGDFSSSGSGTVKMNISVSLRDCIAGETLISNNTCQTCPAGYYNLIAYSMCTACPTGAICYGGDQIFAASGYWRINNQTDVFFPCPNSGACLGEELAGTSKICEAGYTGKLCQACEVGYSRSGDNTCSACMNETNNVLILSGIMALAILVIVVLTSSNVKGAYKEQSITGIYFKILMTYLQIIMLTISFNLNWPRLVLDMFSTQSKAGGTTDQLYSIDCFIGSSFTPYYAKLILLAVLPAICTLFSLVFWTIWGKIKKSTNLKEKIIGSVVVQLFFFQPSLVKYNFAMFDCMEIAPGEYYMTADMSIECWKSEHLEYTLGLVLPSIGLWCIGIPILLIFLINRDQNRLNEIEQKLKFGFLYKGFKPNRFFWEFLTMLRKMLIISSSVFLRNVSVPVQAMVTFLIILAAYILQIKFEPYAVFQLNQMEIKSILVSAVTIYSGMFFLTGDLSDDMKDLVFAVMVLANMTFLSYWVYYTFGFYIGKMYLKLKWCQKCLGPRMDRWVSKVLPEEDITKAETFTEITVNNRKLNDLFSKNSSKLACEELDD